MDLREKILARLQPTQNEEARRQIMVNLPLENIEMMEKIAEAITRESGSHISRNMLIQDAIEAFIKDAEQILAGLKQSGETPDEQPDMTMQQGQTM